MFELGDYVIPTDKEADIEKLRTDYIEGLLSHMDYKDLLETFRSVMLEHLRTLTEDELHEEIEKWGFIVIISGAVSNIIDRIYSGYVIDFIYLHYKKFYWPAFNIADICITIGILMLIINILIKLKKNK